MTLIRCITIDHKAKTIATFFQEFKEAQEVNLCKQEDVEEDGSNW